MVDISSPDAAEQYQAVENILADLGLKDKKKLLVLNKIDRLIQSEPDKENSGLESILAALGLPPGDDIVVISAVKGWGLPRLLGMVSQSVHNPS